MNYSVSLKRPLRANIEAQTQAFLALGRDIKCIEPGVSALSDDGLTPSDAMRREVARSADGRRGAEARRAK